MLKLERNLNLGKLFGNKTQSGFVKTMQI